MVPQTSPLLDRAAKQIAGRLQQAGYKTQISSGAAANAGLTDAIILSVAADAPGTSSETFEIAPIHSNGYLLVRVTGTTARAVYWGAMEAADQIAVSHDLGSVRPQRSNPFLKIRAAQLALPVSATPADQKFWQEYFDLLARNRFNSVFFQARQSVSSFTQLGSESADAPAGAERRDAAVAWLHELFRTAREYGLDPYLGLERDAIAEWVAAAPRGTQPAVAGAPPAGSTAAPQNGVKLRQLLPSILQTYPELTGVAFSAQSLTSPMSVEKPSSWVIENLLSPLGEINDHRPIFFAVGNWWPEQGSLGPVDPDQPVYLVAPYQKLDQFDQAPYPVLWELQSAGEDLLPWQDPAAVQQTIRRLGEKNAAGFLYPEIRDGQPNEILPDISQNWFRASLWGRIGYSPDGTGNHWEQEFGSHFGGGAGIVVYNAAVHANQVLSLLRSYFGAGGMTAAEARDSDPSDLEQTLFQPRLGAGRGDLIADALSEQGLLLQLPDQQNVSTASSALPAAVQRESEVLARAVEQATSRGAWNAGDSALRQKLEAVSQLGLALGDYLTGTQLLARFVVSGAEESRQSAIRLFGQAQQRIGTDTAKPVSSGDLGKALATRIASAVEFSKRARPWQWEKVTWEMGIKDNWQPTTPGETPVPAQWKRVEVSRFSEFGLYGRQPWMTSVNQQLRSAFLNPGLEVAPASGALLVARKTITAKAGDRVAVRVVSDQAPMVWVNQRRAAELSPRVLRWSSSATIGPPMQAELHSASLQEGRNELLIAATAKTNWPLISASFISTSETREMIALGAAQARLSGGLAVLPVIDISPLPYVAVPESDSASPASPENAPAASAATYKFRIRRAGFYRIRLWSNWRFGSKPDLSARLDGSVLKRGIGRGDTVYQKWHWSRIESVAGLGPGEHTLTISGWTRGAWISAVEVYSAW